MTGRPLLCAGPVGRHASEARPTHLGPVSGPGHFCAGHMIPVCVALSLLGRDLATWIWAPSLWRAVPYFALVRPAWLVPYPGPGAWLIPYPGPGALILPCEAKTCPSMMGAWSLCTCDPLGSGAKLALEH